jgi:4-amino-4-deoxy-L-arabinose transferase-like glycosyltransferase
MRNHRAAIVVCLLSVVLAFHLAVAWQSLPTLARNGFLYDDSFYAFKIAQNIAAGRGVTFDGTHPTTGFQPLYVALLVPAFLISGHNPVVPIYMALSLLAVFTTMTVYLMYRISRRYVGEAASIVAALIWAFSPIVTRQSANGLETAIATFMIALSVAYYLEKIRPLVDPPVRRFIVLGILLGIAVLARLDGMLLVLVTLFDYLLLLRRRRTPVRKAVRLTLVPLGVLLLYGPWLLVNVVECGSPLQDSGAATRFLSLAYAGYFGYGAENLGSKGPDLAFIGAHLWRSISTMKVIPPVHVVFRLIERIGTVLGSEGAFRLAGNILGIVGLAFAGASIVRWRRDAKRFLRRELDFLLLFSVILLATYATYIFGMFFFLRYFYPVFFVACIYLAFFLQDARTWFDRRSLRVRKMLILAAAVYAGCFSLFSYSQAFRSQPVYPYYDIARWVDANTVDGEKIGVFQCGTIGYLSHRHIINLDGKVNREALEAIRKGRLENYLEKEGVDVVLDNSRILDIFLGDARAHMKCCYTNLVCASVKLPPGWVAYRRSGVAGRQNAGATTGGGSGVSSVPRLLGD